MEEAVQLAKAKKEMEAAIVGAFAMAKEAVVARPEFPTKKQKDSINRGGCSELQKAKDKDAKVQAAAKEAEKENRAWPADRQKAIRGFEELVAGASWHPIRAQGGRAQATHLLAHGERSARQEQ